MSTSRIFILDWGCDEESRRLEDVLATCERPRFDVRCRHLCSPGPDPAADRLAPEISQFAPAVLVMAIRDVAKVSEARRVVQPFIHHDRQHCPLLVTMGNAAQAAAESFGRTVRDVWSPRFRPREVLGRLRLLLKDLGPGREETAGQLKDRLGLAHIIGESPALLAELRKIPVVAQDDSHVLIRGETGTGKEVFAQALHKHSKRVSGRFVALNCGGMQVDLFENEMFGHVAGAYTGADRDVPGRVERARGGTLFLDEVDTLPLAGQVKLLRLLQDGTYWALGAREEQVADVRVIAATNSDLDEAMRTGHFRADLYHRLNSIQFRLPPLRDRQGDVLLLARHFVQKYGLKSKERECHLTAAAAECLLKYSWPGNVRQLQGALNQAVLLSEKDIIDVADLADFVPVATEGLPRFEDGKAKVIQAYESNYLAKLSLIHSGNLSQGARASGLNRRTLQRLLDKHRRGDAQAPAR